MTVTHAEAHVVLRGLSKIYPGQAAPAVAGLDLELARGGMLALLGPSGCGKTTTLRMIAGLVEPSAGSIAIGGVDVTRAPVHQRNIGMVFQSYALFPHMSVEQNVGFGLEMQGVPRAERKRRVAQALDTVRLGDKASRRIKQLSGGQQQRIALARALITEPQVLLLDEPLSNLDAKLREALRIEIRAIQQRTSITAVFVTHDQDEALAMADRIAVMQDGQLVQVGAPADIYDAPANRFVADFIGRANFIEAVVSSSDAGGITVTAAALAGGARQLPAQPARRAGEAVTLMVRPHHFYLDDGAAPGALRLDASVADVAYRGDLLTYQMQAAGQLITVELHAHAPRRAPLANGQPVTLACRPDAVVLL